MPGTGCEGKGLHSEGLFERQVVGVRKYGLFGTPNPKLPLTNNVNPTLILGIFLKKWEL